jgi:hypothetical protein
MSGSGMTGIVQRSIIQPETPHLLAAAYENNAK